MASSSHGMVLRCLATGTLERDDDAAFVAFADALGADVFAISERNVDDTALVRWHCFKRDGTAVVAHLLGDAQSERAQVFLAAFAVIFGVDVDAHSMLGAMSHNEADEQLQRREGFAAPSDEQSQVLVDALDVEGQWTGGAYLDDGANIHVL